MATQTLSPSELATPSPFGGRAVIDIDSHYSEPHDLWTKRAPAKLKGLVPRVGEIDGRLSWIIGENHSIGFGASPVSTIRRDGSKAPGLEWLHLGFDEIHAACSDVSARVSLMDSIGISAQILYPNVLGFGGQAGALVDPELRLVSTQIFNDAMAELQEQSGQRIFPMALLPWWDRNLMIKEAQRTHGMGLRGVNINPHPYEHRDTEGKAIPDLGHAHWDPFWELCQDLDLPINFHIGASDANMDWSLGQSWPSITPTSKYIISSSMLFVANAAVMGNLIFSGVLDRFPRLKFVSVESGLGWVPFFAETLNYQYAETGKLERLKKDPSEYLKSNIYTSFWFERDDLARNIRRVGIDNVMFETDFPHPTCLYPVEGVEAAFAELAEDEIRKVLSGNAARVYNLQSIVAKR